MCPSPASVSRQRERHVQRCCVHAVCDTGVARRNARRAEAARAARRAGGTAEPDAESPRLSCPRGRRSPRCRPWGKPEAGSDQRDNPTSPAPGIASTSPGRLWCLGRLRRTFCHCTDLPTRPGGRQRHRQRLLGLHLNTASGLPRPSIQLPKLSQTYKGNNQQTGCTAYADEPLRGRSGMINRVLHSANSRSSGASSRSHPESPTIQRSPLAPTPRGREKTSRKKEKITPEQIRTNQPKDRGGKRRKNKTDTQGEKKCAYGGTNL